MLRPKSGFETTPKAPSIPSRASRPVGKGKRERAVRPHEKQKPYLL